MAIQKKIIDQAIKDCLLILYQQLNKSKTKYCERRHCWLINGEWQGGYAFQYFKDASGASDATDASFSCRRGLYR